MSLHSCEIGEKYFSGAKARVDFVSFMRRLKPPPPSGLSFAIQNVCCFAVILSMAANYVYAQTASTPQPAPVYSIAGTVVNTASGEPVRRATVAVLSEEDQQTVASAETDDEGRFSLDGLAAGKYPLTASKRGFLTAYYDQHEGYNTAIVAGEGQETNKIVFRLVPGAVLRGVVTGDGGDPVEGAQVMLFLKPHGHNPGARISQAGATKTDDTGAYGFDGLAAGEYLLAVKAEPWFAIHQSIRGAFDSGAALDVAYPVTYFDATTNEADATAIVLIGGRSVEANINLHALPALHLTVEPVVKEDGTSLRAELRQSIFGTENQDAVVASPLGKQTGRGEFAGVAPGHYELTQGDPPRVAEFDVATTNQQIDPNMGSTAVTVSGILQTANGAAMPENPRIFLISLDDAHPHAPLETTGSRGKFSFAAVPPGSWGLWAENSGKSLTITSIFAAGKTHPGNQLTVQDKPIPLVASVSQSETRVEGFARDVKGKGIAGVMIVLVPKEPSAFSALVRRDQSDSDGSFSLRDVASGEYTVVAIEKGWELDWARPEVISRYLSQGLTVTVTENSGKMLRLSQPVPVQSR
jgi:hypothetical protein